MCILRGPGGSILSGSQSSGHTVSVKTSQEPVYYLRVVCGRLYVLIAALLFGLPPMLKVPRSPQLRKWQQMLIKWWSSLATPIQPMEIQESYHYMWWEQQKDSKGEFHVLEACRWLWGEFQHLEPSGDIDIFTSVLFKQPSQINLEKPLVGVL